MTRRLLAGVVMGVLAVGLAQGAVLRYRQSGAWQDLNAGATHGWGLNPNNDGVTPGTSVPVAGDEARVNWGNNTITVGYSAPTFGRLMIGVNESGNVEVNANGVITTTGDVLAGNNNASATGTLIVNTGGIVNVGSILYAAHNSSTGFITINSGGQVNAASHLWLGSSGTATVNISGTLNQTGGILGLGTTNAVDPSGGTATVNILNGGLLALNNIHGGLTSIQPGSIIDISGTGQLTVPGNFVGVLTNYANGNQLSGNGVPGLSNLLIDTTTNSGFTTVTAIPEPATLGLLGAFGAFGLLLRRRS